MAVDNTNDVFESSRTGLNSAVNRGATLLLLLRLALCHGAEKKLMMTAP
jgi:hypothetical protein